MWHFRFFRTILVVLALLGFMESRTALAAYPISSEFSMNQAKETLGLDGSFQLAVMGNGAAPLDIPTGKFPKKVKSEKPAVEKPKTTAKATQKTSKPKKKKVKLAKAKRAPAKEPVVEEEESFLSKTLKTLVGGDEDKKSNSLVKKSAGKKPEPAKKEEGLLSKTLNTLVGGGENKKKAPSKAKPQKTAGKKPEPEKKEEGLLTKTFKSLVGSDKKDKKKEKTAKKKSLSQINMAPTASMAKKKEKEVSKTTTAKSETKKTLKDSFQKLIGVGAVDKSDIKPEPKVTKKAEVKKAVEKKAPLKPRITARKYVEDEEKQFKKDRKVVKGKNVLKDSFQKLIADDDKQKALTK